MIIVTFMSGGFVIFLFESGGEYSLLQTTQEQTLALLRVPPLSHSETTKIVLTEFYNYLTTLYTGCFHFKGKLFLQEFDLICEQMTVVHANYAQTGSKLTPGN